MPASYAYSPVTKTSKRASLARLTEFHAADPRRRMFSAAANFPLLFGPGCREGREPLGAAGESASRANDALCHVLCAIVEAKQKGPFTRAERFASEPETRRRLSVCPREIREERARIETHPKQHSKNTIWRRILQHGPVISFLSLCCGVFRRFH